MNNLMHLTPEQAMELSIALRRAAEQVQSARHEQNLIDAYMYVRVPNEGTKIRVGS